MLYHKPVLPLCLIASLAGCTAVPGMYMPRGDVSEVEVPVLEDGTAAQVDIVPITAELVVEQQRRLAERRRALPRPEQLPYESYRIGPRDVLSITVWDHPELTIPAGEFRSAEAAGHLVDEDGTLFYPYVGSIDVEGMTVEQLRRLLTRRLSTYIENPQLDVRVAAYRSKRTYITGEVAAPGIQPITDVPLTVTEAVNRAGGLTDQADLRNASLTREGQVYPLDLLALFEQGDMSQDFLLREGDILTVPDVNRSQNKIFVLGEVLEPSSRLINRGRMSLTEALDFQIVVMQGNHNQSAGEVPLVEHRRPHHRVGIRKVFPLQFPIAAFTSIGRLSQRVIALLIAVIHHHLAKVTEQPGQKRLLRVAGGKLAGQDPTADGTADGIFPEQFLQQPIRLVHALQACRQNQAAQGPLSNDGDGMIQGLDLACHAVKRRVGNFQQPGRDGRITGDGFPQLAVVDVGIPQQFHDLGGHGGYRRQVADGTYNSLEVGRHDHLLAAFMIACSLYQN